MGLFDAKFARFACGLEVALWRFQMGDQLRTIDPADRDGVPVVEPAPPLSLTVMRTDDNGNDFEVKRVTNRCEAAALVRTYEARGHKQTYWFADVVASTDR